MFQSRKKKIISSFFNTLGSMMLMLKLNFWELRQELQWEMNRKSKYKIKGLWACFEEIRCIVSFRLEEIIFLKIHWMNSMLLKIIWENLYKLFLRENQELMLEEYKRNSFNLQSENYLILSTQCLSTMKKKDITGSMETL